MSADILIGVDAGTSVIKAVAFDVSGRQIAIASRRNTYTSLPNGGVEQNMQRTWEDTAAVLREVAETVGANRVCALGVTAQGDGTWLVDHEGTPIQDGWLWLDARSAAEARAIETSEGIDTIYRHTGSGVNVCQMRTHFLWMERNSPELLERASTAFHCKDWLYYKLTDIRATDPTEGVFTFGDYRTRDYSDEVLDALGLNAYRSLLPDILDGARDTHGLTVEAAAATGLPQGLPVSLGYVDIMCTAFGGGLYDEAALPGFTILGSTGVHMRFARTVDDVRLNTDRTGYTMAFPGTAYAQLQTNMAATLNLDWILSVGAELLNAQGGDVEPADLLAGLDDRIVTARPGAVLYHPYISSAGERGPFTNPAARASFTGLDQNTGWFDLVRGVYDGLILAARECYAAMGETPAEIRLGGGAARSSALQRFLASALARPVRTVAQEEAGAAGAVMMAGLATGLFDSPSSAARAWVEPLLQEPVEPETELTATYDALYAAYTETRAAFPKIWEAQKSMREAVS
ncbi:FGGY-family carbohydrate kinase [Ruegeria sp. 2205SS24-7]|uniref:FGGY-family carbohydrate kinase n=1 Tax=Ruegeria discodermiae TaxID=3064389 RepID=UPI0027403514|nr:FGGY-family carbohydrate kinase [Ruegeria sp. 2205SS24-7]MDP5220966.1 FGGY-family carbohydrate kinase [Ruegeria sp. 2205SS24-7]